MDGLDRAWMASVMQEPWMALMPGFILSFVRVVRGQVLNAGFKLCLESWFH